MEGYVLVWVQFIQLFLGGNIFCLLEVDEYTRFKWSRFMKFKILVSPKICDIVKYIETSVIKIIYLRFYNEGENLVVYNYLRDDKVTNINIEYTYPYTNQQMV